MPGCRSFAALCALPLVACDGGVISLTETGVVQVDTGGVDTEDSATEPTETGDSAETGETGGPGDTGDTGETDTDPPGAEWCSDFESGLLVDIGYVGDKAVLWDGAILTNVAEGEDFSALNGEEAIAFRGDRALLMRSSEEGEVASIAIVTTLDFTVVEPHLTWWQLSEVDERGLVLAVDVLTVESTVLASALVPLLGGHEAGLQEDSEGIAELPELAAGPGTPGSFAGQYIDLSPWTGEEIKVRFYQHTLVEGSGFFTLVDDMCTGTVEPDHTLVELGEPSDRW